MTDTAKWTIGFLGWLILALSSYYFSKSKLCASLPVDAQEHIVSDREGTVVENEPSEAKTVIREPIDFNLSNAQPFLNEDFEELKETILAAATSDNLLEITGYYYKIERNTSTYANMGLARGNAVKQLLSKDFPKNRIRIKAKKRSDSEPTKEFFEAIDFDWVVEKTPTVEVFTDKTIIRFPFNSVKKEVNPEIDAYLAKLAKRIIETKEKVNLTGHTDNIGDPDINVQLALRRAKMIRDILIEKGVKRRQINTYSKGMTNPIADNETEDGRQKNRRVVVRLISAE